MEKKGEYVGKTAKEYETILKYLPSVIWESDLEGNTYFISESIQKVLGYMPSQIISHEIKWFDITHPQELNFIKNEFKSFLSGKFEYDVEYRVKNATGNWRWIHDTAFLDAKDGNVIGSFSDITDRKENELKTFKDLTLFRVLFETSLDSIFLLNSKIEWIEANPSALAIFGANSKEELFSYNAVLLSPEFQPDGRKSEEKANTLVKNCLRKGFTRFEWTHKKISGELFHTLISLQILDMGSSDDRMVCWMRDISSLKKAEIRRIQRHKMEAISLLAGGIAHDVNNLLSIIIGNLNLIQISDGINPEIQELSEDAEEASLKAKNLNQQLIKFAQIGSPVKNYYSIGELIRETADFISRGRSVAIHYDFPIDLWDAEFDKVQIGQVVQNLVLNAIQAMNNQGKIIIKGCNVQVENEETNGLEEGNYVKIEVTDTGNGIPPEIIARIFDPYFTTKHDGTGLGLAICHSILKNHGGILSVDSQVGQGSTFSFYLPALPIDSKIQ